MKDNTALKFQNEESYKLVKETLDVSFLNPTVLLGVSEKAILSINYWEARKLKNATKEQIEIYNVEIAKLEALMQRVSDMCIDIYSVNAEAYLDSRGSVADKGVEDILQEVAEKADAKDISIFSGEEELKTPHIDDLKEALKQILKKGHFDSAMLLATKFLSVGDYIPKKPLKDGQTPEKWTEAKIAGWIRDLNNALLEGKSDKKKVETKKTANDAASKGLTTDEVENLRLLETVIPDAIAGHQDYKTRREKLETYLKVGKDLNAEDDMLWAVAKRILGAVTSKLPEKDLMDLYKDIDDFCKVFFKHRGYTEESVKAWRKAAQTVTGINNFHYLTTGKDVDPMKLKKANITLEAINKRVKDDYEAGKTVAEIVKSLEEGLLYKVVSGKEKGSDYNIYTKLHLKDLIERMYNVHTTKPKTDPDTKPAFITDKVDVANVKILVDTIIANGGILEDMHKHPDILSLINKEIFDGKNAPAMKFGNETTLFGWLDKVFEEIDAEYKPIEDKVAEPEFADLDKMLTLAEFAAKNDVTQEDFIKENKDLIVDKDGKYKSMKSTNAKGGSKTISIANAKDFETWVSEVYKIQTKLKENEGKSTSLKELAAEGWKRLAKNPSYEEFITWLNDNLLNRKMTEQKPEKVFKTKEAIADFAKNTFGKKLPQLVKKTEETAAPVKTEKTGIEPGSTLSEDEIKAVIQKQSLLSNATFPGLAKQMRDLYIRNGILVDGEVMTGKTSMIILEDVIKDVNPEMYTERMKRKAEAQVRREQENATQASLPFTKETDKPVVDAEHVVFEKVDIAAVDPALWELIKKFKTMDEVYNMAVEFNEAGKFNEALSMCLLVMPTQIEASKDWTPEQITTWFNTNVLKKTEEPAAEQQSADNSEEIVLGEEFKSLMESTNKKTTSQAVMDILKSKEDNANLRKQLIAAFHRGKGSHVRTVGKMPDGEIHKYINNQKEKIGKYSNKTEE